MVVRSPFSTMKASPWEIEDAQREDIPIYNNMPPKEFVVKDGRLTGIIFEKVRAEQFALGNQVRALFESRGIASVAADGFKAPGVVVSYTTDPDIQNSKKFLALGLQTAAGVPLQCDEPADFMSFRVGLFGLEKLHNVDRSVAHLASALDQLGLPAAAA